MWEGVYTQMHREARGIESPETRITGGYEPLDRSPGNQQTDLNCRDTSLAPSWAFHHRIRKTCPDS